MFTPIHHIPGVILAIPQPTVPRICTIGFPRGGGGPWLPKFLENSCKINCDVCTLPILDVRHLAPNSILWQTLWLKQHFYSLNKHMSYSIICDFSKIVIRSSDRASDLHSRSLSLKSVHNANDQLIITSICTRTALLYEYTILRCCTA